MNIYTNIILKFITIYLYIKNSIIKLLPIYIYQTRYTHKTINLDYEIYEYLKKYNSKYNKFKIIKIYDLKDHEKLIIDDIQNNTNLINYCGIIDEYNNEIMDITEQIRSFMHYNGLISWKYILIHLDIEHLFENRVIIYLNNIDMTEKIVNIKDIYEQKFIIV